jgi:hypothetical protein
MYLPLPDGSYLQIKEGETPQQAWERAQRTYPQVFADPDKAQSGGIANLKAGVKGTLGAYRTALAGDDEATRIAARQSQATDIETAKTTEWEDVKNAFGEGLGGGISTLGAFARDQVARSAPQMAATVAGGAAGAKLGAMLGPVGAAVGGVGGALLANVPAMVGQNLERQVSEQDATGQQAPLDRTAATTAGVAQGALDAASTFFMLGKLGLKGAGALMNKPLAEAEAALVKKAQQSLVGAVAKGAARGAAAEMPTELAQQVLERAQAGLPLTDASARKEYEAAAAGGGVVGGLLGPLGGVGDRSRAREQVERIQEERAAKAMRDAEEAKQKAEFDAKGDPLDVWLKNQGPDGIPTTQSVPSDDPASIEELALRGTDENIMAPPEAQVKLNQALEAAQYRPSMTGKDLKPIEVLAVLQKRPDLAHAVLQGEAIIPWLDGKTTKDIIKTLRKTQGAGLPKQFGDIEREMFRGELADQAELDDEIASNLKEDPLKQAQEANVQPMPPATKPEIKQYLSAPLDQRGLPRTAEYAQEMEPEAPPAETIEDAVGIKKPQLSADTQLQKILDDALPEGVNRGELAEQEQELTDNRKHMLAQLNEYADNQLDRSDPKTRGQRKLAGMQVESLVKNLAQNALDQIAASRELNGYGPMPWQDAAELSKFISTGIRRHLYSRKGDRESGSAKVIENQRIRDMQDRLNQQIEALSTNAVDGRGRSMKDGGRNVERMERLQKIVRDLALRSQKEENLDAFLQRTIDDWVFAGQKAGKPVGERQAAKTPFQLRSDQDNAQFDARRSREYTDDPFEQTARRINEMPTEANKMRLLEQAKSAQMRGRMQRPQTEREMQLAARQQIEDDTRQGDLFGNRDRVRPLKGRPTIKPKAKPVPLSQNPELQEAKYNAEAAKERKASVLQFHSDVIAAHAAERDARRTLEFRREKLRDVVRGRGQAFNEAKEKLDKVKSVLDVMVQREEQLRGALIKARSEDQRTDLAITVSKLQDRIEAQQEKVKAAQRAFDESDNRAWPFEVNRASGDLVAAERDLDAAVDRFVTLENKLREIRATLTDDDKVLQKRYESIRDRLERRDTGDAKRALEAAAKERKAAEKLIAEQKTLEEREKTDIKVPAKRYTGDKYEAAEKMKEAALRAAAVNVRKGAAQTGQSVEQFIEAMDAQALEALVEKAKKKVSNVVETAKEKGVDISGDPSNWAKRWIEPTNEALEEMIRRGEVPKPEDLDMAKLARVVARMANETDVRPQHKAPQRLKTGSREAKGAENQQAKNRKILSERLARQKQFEREALGDVEYSKMPEPGDMTRRSFVIGSAAVLASNPARADVTLGRARPISQGVLEAKMPEAAEKALRAVSGKKDGAMGIKFALEAIAKDGPQELRALARKVKDLLPETGVKLTIDDKTPMMAHGAVEMRPPHLRLFTAGGRKGLSNSTFIHEALHLAIVARYHSLNIGLQRSNDKVLGTETPGAAAALAQFRGVYMEFKEMARPDIANETDSLLKLALREAVSNPDEFFVRALTDDKLQAYMAKKKYEGKTLWERFKDWVKTSLFGMKKEGQEASWLDAALVASNDLMSAMFKDTPDFNRMLAAFKVTGQDDKHNHNSVMYSKAPQFDAVGQEYAALHQAIVGEHNKSFLKEFWPSALAMRTKFLDRFAGLQAIKDMTPAQIAESKARAEAARRKDAVPGEEDTAEERAAKLDDAVQAGNMIYASRAYDQKNSFVAEVAIDGPMKIIKDKNGRILFEAQKDGPSMKKIAQLISKAEGGGDANGRAALYDTYRKAKRAQRVGWDWLGHNLTTEQRALGDKLVANPLPWFKEVDEVYNAYNKGLIDFAIASGAIPADVGRSMTESNDYIPYYRVDKDEVTLSLDAGPPISIGNLKHQPYLKELVGGDAKTMPFWAATLQNTSLLTDLAMRNLATRNTAFALKEFGMGKFVAPNADGANVIRFKIDGKDKAFRVDSDAAGVPSELIVKGMEGVAVSLPSALQWMGMPAKLLRKMVTRNPVYMVKQLFRDSMWTAIASGADMMPVLSSLKEVSKAVRGKADDRLRRRGIVGGNLFSHDLFDNERLLRDFAAGKTGWGMAMAKLDAMSLEADAATRRAAFDSYIKQGLSEQEATLAALESMNFSRHGTSASLRMLSTMIPFMNAQLQGLDALYRAFRGKMPHEQKLNIKKKLIARGTMLAGMTMMYAMAMQDDEAYQNADVADRLNNWFVRVPGIDEPVKIPMPFELGFIFKAIPEALVGVMSEDLKEDEAARALGELAWMSVPNVLMPQGMKPALEVMFNKSMLNWADIESDGDQKVAKSMRYNDRTSELAKALAFDMDIAGRHLGISPKQIEHLVRGYTAGLGTAIFKAMDVFMPVDAPKPEKLSSELPVVGSMLQPVDSLGRINKLYRTLEKYERAKGTFEKLIEEDRMEEAERYADANMEDIALADGARGIRKQIAEYREQERLIRMDKDLTPAEKREALTEIRREQLQFMKDAREYLQ